MRDVCVKISSIIRTTCARSLYVDYANPFPRSLFRGSLHQDPVVGPLARDHCMWISCTRCLSGCLYQEPL